MEITIDINQYCGQDKNGYIILKDSGVVLGRGSRCVKKNNQLIFENVISMTVVDMCRFHDRGIKISGNMPTHTNHNLDSEWLKNEYIKALQPDYPLMQYVNGGKVNGEVVLKYDESHSISIGDIELKIFVSDTGNVRICNPMDKLQFLILDSQTSLTVDGYATYVDDNQGLLYGQYVSFKHKSTRQMLRIQYNIIVSKVLMAKSVQTFTVEDPKTQLSNLLTQKQDSVSFFNNLAKFYQTCEPSISSELTTYRKKLISCDGDIENIQEILKKYELSIPEKMIKERQRVVDKIAQLEKYDFDSLCETVYNHLKNWKI